MIARKTWREIRGMTLAYFVILEALLIVTLLYWPQLRSALERGAGGFMQAIPIEFARRIIRGMAARDPDLAFRAYVAAEQFFRSINVVGIAAAVLFGTGAIARERENRTLEFLLSRPIRRRAVLDRKLAVLLPALVVPIFASSLSIPPIARALGHTLPLGPLLLASWHGALFVSVFLLATVYCSTLFRTQVHVAFAIGGFVIFEVGIYFVKGIRSISVFRLSDYDIYMPILSGNLPFGRLFLERELWLAASGVLLYLLALRRLERMDL